ncbi:MAG TPA: endonuclease domain-containing protein, partial [Polyangiaceae bacterium]|nr:endonuclease domain-containing protein [Polyangiaceae bacterium]
ESRANLHGAATKAEGDCHAFLAGKGMHTPDAPTLFSLTAVARSLRKNMTPAERRLWRWLCHSQLGVRVRRQHPLHPFVADFYVASHKLVVEVDGAVHRTPEARRRDVWRDAELARLYGVRVLRIDADLVERDVFAAVALVRAALR